MDLDARGRSSLSRDDVHLVTGGGESVSDPPRHVFDAAPGLEAFDHEGDAHAALEPG
jgi:hypothetical protein